MAAEADAADATGVGTAPLSPAVHVAASKEEVGQFLVQRVREIAEESVRRDGRFTLALSGGSLPKMLAGLREQVGQEWEKWFVSFADERCVPLDHEDSNYRAALEAVLRAEGQGEEEAMTLVPRDQLITIEEEGDPEQAAQRYAERLTETSAMESGFPRLDLVLLGMGPDGHTASLFPGHALLDESELAVASITDSPKPPPERITMTYPVLNNARHVIFVVTGDAKAAVLSDLFTVQGEGDGATMALQDDTPYPAGRVRPHSGTLEWLLDAGAASGLQPPARALALEL